MYSIEDIIILFKLNLSSLVYCAGALPYQGGLLGNGSGPILFGYLNCIGTEVSLSECEALRSVPFGTGHSNDAGVRCLNDSK